MPSVSLAVLPRVVSLMLRQGVGVSLMLLAVWNYFEYLWYYHVSGMSDLENSSHIN